MQIDKPQEHIDRNLLHQPQRHPLILELIMLYQVQQIRPQYLEHRTTMLPMNPVMVEAIVQEQRTAEFGVYVLWVLMLEGGQLLDPRGVFLVPADLVQDLHLVHCGFRVGLLTSLDFQGCVLLGCLVLD